MTTQTMPAARRFSAADGVALAGVAGIAAAGLVFSPDSIDSGPIICPFRALTGLPCPGCGLTRSWVFLMHGHVGDSLGFHPFGWLLIVGIVVLAVTTVVRRVRGQAPPDLDRFVRGRAVIALLIVWLGFSIARGVLSATVAGPTFHGLWIG